VVETAAIGFAREGGGPAELVVYVVTTIDAPNADLKRKLQEQIRQTLNPLFKIKEVHTIDRLPRTASNKLIRRILRPNRLT